jgi:hypothetical protein
MNIRLAETTNPALSNQILVQIEIVGGKIHCYPRRADETLIYYCHDKNVPPEGRPCEVRWVVTGLQRDQYIQIEPKDPVGKAMFDPQPPFKVEFGFNSIRSGPPQQRAGKGKSLRWSYKITLYDPNALPPVLGWLDPDIIIKDWP